MKTAKINARLLLTNKNVLVVGGSGSGKTRFFIKPNIMQCTKTKGTSIVVTDPKGYNVLAYRRQYDTERKHNLIAAAQTDPLAAERLAMERRNAVEATQRWKAKRI